VSGNEAGVGGGVGREVLEFSEGEKGLAEPCSAMRRGMAPPRWYIVSQETSVRSLWKSSSGFGRRSVISWTIATCFRWDFERWLGLARCGTRKKDGPCKPHSLGKCR